LDRGEVGEELVDFGRALFFGVALVVEEDVYLCPVDVGVASARGIMFEVDGVAILGEEFFSFPGGGDWGRFGCVILKPFLRLQAYNLCICT
jgi:hypothetical protein